MSATRRAFSNKALVPTVNPPRPGTSLTMRPRDWDRLSGHLFGQDDDEHGAVVLAEQVIGPRGVRLLAREVILAREAIDYVPGTSGYRALTADFVRDCAVRARRKNLVYIPVHNHFSGPSVGFSTTDLDSHERGYPALVNLTGNSVMSLVLTPLAAAGDVFRPDGSRGHLAELVVPGRNVLRLREHPARPGRADGRRASATVAGADNASADASLAMYDRQARLFGDVGQAVLGAMRVAVVGLGGAGSLLVEMLARLGVGTLVLIDADIVTIHNLPRLVGASFGDLDLPKTDLAAHNARRANPHIVLDIHQVEVQNRDALAALEQCDWIFLAADTHGARHWVNQIVETHLIPGTQVGVKIPTDVAGNVGLIHTISRRLMPGAGCMWCNGLINPTELAIDMSPATQRRAARYVAEVPAPSVITLNAVAVAEAANDFLFAVTNLHLPDPPDLNDGSAPADPRPGAEPLVETSLAEYAATFPRHRRVQRITPRRDPACTWCSDTGGTAEQA